MAGAETGGAGDRPEPGRCRSDGTEGGVVDDLEERIRRRAYEIWERNGRPEGREADHWKLASEEIAIEDNQKQTLLPNPSGGGDDTATRTEPVEPLLSVESQTEGIAPAGQDENQPAPVRRTRAARAPARKGGATAETEAEPEMASAEPAGRKRTAADKPSGKGGKRG